jgi:hypothetical protein
VIAGMVPHANDRLIVRLRDGREVAGRTVALPRAIGSGGAAAVVLGPHDVSRELLVSGRSGSSYALVLPSAAAQCGYRTSVGPFL